MGFLLVVDLEFDILDAAVYECLPGYASLGWVEFERRTLTPVSVEYDMFLHKHGNLGDLGAIIVRKIGPQKSLLHFRDPERPRVKQPSQAEWNSYDFAQYPREERISKKLEIFRKYQEEADKLYARRREHQKQIITALFSRLANDPATQHVFSKQNTLEPSDVSPLDEVKERLQDFRDFVERQAYQDISDDKGPQEKYARALLQAFLTSRSYREVPVRGGRSDILIPVQGGRLLFETKIWRGERYYSAGLHEIAEYIRGENSDGKLLGAFYVVFDPTKTHRAVNYIGAHMTTVNVGGFSVEVVVINLSPEIPSRKALA